MNRKLFFDSLRARASGVFGTSLSAAQVLGVEAILDEAARRNTPLSHLAYMLGTAYHETGAKMVPNVEILNYTSAARIRAVWPSRFPTEASAAPYVRNPRGLANKVYNGRMGNRAGSDDGWLFRGRGLPHLTGRDNYVRASNKTGTDLVSSPDRALELPIAVKVLFDGMGEGWFTGQRMSQHLNKTPPDYVNARKIVNGTDKAADIAGYARAFENALKAGGYSAASQPSAPHPPGADPHPAPPVSAPKPIPAPTPPPVTEPRPAPAPASKTGIGAAVVAIIAAIGAAVAYFTGG